MARSEYQILIDIDAKLDGLNAASRGLEATKAKTNALSLAVGGLVQSFGAMTVGAVGAAATLGVRFNAQIEQLSIGFETLLGSVDAADKRMRDLVTFSAATPFQLAEIARASRLLQALTGDALSSGEGLRIVGDAAAAVGGSFEETAMWIGRLYAGLRSGTPVGEATSRLLEMGLITGEARRELEELAGTARDSEDAFAIIAQTFEKSAGAMEKQAKSFNGLVSTLVDNLNILAGETMLPVFDGLTDGIEGLLIAMGALNSALDTQQDQWLSYVRNLRESVAGATVETRDALLEQIDQQLKVQTRVMQAAREASKVETKRGNKAKPNEDLVADALEQEIRLRRLLALRKELAAMSPEQLKENQRTQTQAAEMTQAQQILKTMAAQATTAENELQTLREKLMTDRERLDLLERQREEVIEQRKQAIQQGLEGKDALLAQEQAGIQLQLIDLKILELRKAINKENEKANLLDQRNAELRLKQLGYAATEGGFIRQPQDRIGQLRAGYFGQDIVDQNLQPTGQRTRGAQDGQFANLNDAVQGGLLESLTRMGSILDGISDGFSNIVDTLQGSLSDALFDVFTMTKTWGEAAAGIGIALGRSMLRALTDIVAQYITTQLIMFLFGKSLQAAALATTIGFASVSAAAWAPAAVAANTATFGAAGTLALAQTTAQMQAASGLALFRKGGYTGDGNPNDIAGAVHKKEVVFSMEDVARWGGAAKLDAMRVAGPASLAEMSTGGGLSTSSARSIASPLTNRNETRVNITVVKNDGSRAARRRQIAGARGAIVELN